MGSRSRAEAMRDLVRARATAVGMLSKARQHPLISSTAAARQIDRDLLNLFRSFQANRSMIFRKLILPSALPWIFSTLRVNIGFALIGAVVGEYIASQSGLGHAVFVAGSLFDLNTVWLGIIILTLMATLLTWIVQLAENRIISWKAKR